MMFSFFHWLKVNEGYFEHETKLTLVLKCLLFKSSSLMF